MTAMGYIQMYFSMYIEICKQTSRQAMDLNGYCRKSCVRAAIIQSPQLLLERGRTTRPNSQRRCAEIRQPLRTKPPEKSLKQSYLLRGRRESGKRYTHSRRHTHTHMHTHTERDREPHACIRRRKVCSFGRETTEKHGVSLFLRHNVGEKQEIHHGRSDDREDFPLSRPTHHGAGTR